MTEMVSENKSERLLPGKREVGDIKGRPLFAF